MARTLFGVMHVNDCPGIPEFWNLKLVQSTYNLRSLRPCLK